MHVCMYVCMYVCISVTESEQIRSGREEVDQLWVDLKDLAEARSLALAGAKEIHTFDRDAADAKERVQACTHVAGG